VENFLVSRPGDRAMFAPDIQEMHRLRADVFGARLNWAVSCVNGVERDVYDELGPTYIMVRGRSGKVEASCRLLPTTGPYMLKDVFPDLLGHRPAPCEDGIWEVSRFAVVPAGCENWSLGSIHRLTLELLIELVVVGLANNIQKIVTVADPRFERVLGRANLIYEKFPIEIYVDSSKAIAGSMPVTLENLSRLIASYNALLRKDQYIGDDNQEYAA